MSGDRGNKTDPAPAVAPPAQAADRDAGGAAQGAFSRWLRRGWSIAALSGALSILWAAYTYSEQQAEQRRQDFLQAYNLVAGDLGQNVVGSVTAAIAPFYREPAITDREWTDARTCYDELVAANAARDCLSGESEQPEAARRRLFATMQGWILAHVLIKDGHHDTYIHNYQYAANDLKFLYQYAAADPCNWVVVAFKFKKNAYDFWYYYPGSYDFSGTGVKALPPAAEAMLLRGDLEQEAEQRCLAGFVSIPNKVTEPILGPLRRLL